MQLKSRKILYIVFGVWIALVALLLLFLGILTKTQVIENAILDKYNLGYKAQKLTIGVDFRLNLNINAENLIICNKKKDKDFIILKNPQISLKPISLLFRKIYVKKFNSDNMIVKITRDKFGKIDIIDNCKFNHNDFANSTITRFDSNIRSIKLIYDDNYNTKRLTEFVLNDSNIKILKNKNIVSINEKGLVLTSINGIPVQSSDIHINIVSDYLFNNPVFDISLKNVNLCFLSDLVKKYISNDIMSFGAMIDLNIKTDEEHKINVAINNLKMLLKNGKTICPYKKINIYSEILTNRDKLTLKRIDIIANQLFVNINGNILKPFSKNPKLDLTTEIKDTQINNLLYLIPDNAIVYRSQGIPVLKKSNFHAVLNGKTEIKYSPLDITGTVKVQNIHIPGYPKPYMQNDATLIFMKDKMRVYTRVYTQENEYVIVDGISNLDDSLYGKYNIKSTKKIDLSFAQLYLVPIQQIIGFNIGPVPIMDITGYGNIDIKTQGTIKDAQIFGQFSAYNATAKIHGLDAKLINGDCRLVFDNKNLIFKEIKGTIDGAKFLLTGIGNTKGEVDLNVKINDAYLNNILKTFNNSILTKDYTDLTKNIAATSGRVNIQANLKGLIQDYEKEDFLNNLALGGNFELKNDKIILNNGLSVKNISGIVNFDENAGQNGYFEFNINNSKFNANFDTKEKLSKISSKEPFVLTASVSSKKCAFSDILNEILNSKILSDKNIKLTEYLNDIDFYSKINLNSKGKISINRFDLNNFKTNGYIVGLNSKINKNINFLHGVIKIDNNNIIFDNFKTEIFDGLINIKGSLDNILRISLNNINLEKFDNFIPKVKLQNAILKSGEILLNKNEINFNSINIDYNKMPLVANLSYKLKDNNVHADFSTILNESNADYTINPYLSYPIKIKGEIPLKGKFVGTSRNYSIDFTTFIPKESDISYSGANIGDISQDREITGKINVNHNILTLNNLRLIKYIKNQNNKLNPVTSINLNGKVIQKDNNVFYDNFKVVTQNPVNVRILNLIFKKSILKKGNFECNLNLNGAMLSPKLVGKIDLQDLDVPLYDIKINNIKVDISQNDLDAVITAKNKQSDIKASIRAKNNLSAPYIIDKLFISSNKLDLHDLIDSVPIQSTKTDIVKKQDFVLKPEDIIIKSGSINLDELIFDKISAQNLKSSFTYKDEIFNLEDIVFDIAKGSIAARGDYDLKTTKLNIKANMYECDANLLASNFLNITGQIFGKMTGNVILSAKNLNNPNGIKNIKSNVNFSINNGKMPKLGSLEYLLRAGNVLRNGILGLSLNNIIQVLTPYKTGEFEKIAGSLDISGGNIKNLEIYSKGKNLSMYLFGDYHILENFADIKLYGRLSQNVSSALGSIGNISIRQFINSFTINNDSRRDSHLVEILNKIPPVDGSDQGGYFSAKVYGDINKDNYIRKFSWE